MKCGIVRNCFFLTANAAIVDIEKTLPPRTRGGPERHAGGYFGHILTIKDFDLQVTGWCEEFQHGGASPQLDVNRVVVLGETSAFIFLLGTGIVPLAHDWTHTIHSSGSAINTQRPQWIRGPDRCLCLITETRVAMQGAAKIAAWRLLADGTNMTLPVLGQDVRVYCFALGSAQLRSTSKGRFPIGRF